MVRSADASAHSRRDAVGKFTEQIPKGGYCLAAEISSTAGRQDVGVFKAGHDLDKRLRLTIKWLAPNVVI